MPVDFLVGISGLEESEQLLLMAGLAKLPDFEVTRIVDSKDHGDEHNDTSYTGAKDSDIDSPKKISAVNDETSTEVSEQSHPTFSPFMNRKDPSAEVSSSQLDGVASTKLVTYPAPFLLYGSLEDPAILSRVLGISPSVASELQKAHVFGFGLEEGQSHEKKAFRTNQLAKTEGLVYWVQTPTEEAALVAHHKRALEIEECKIYIGVAGEGQEKIAEGFIFVSKQ